MEQLVGTGVALITPFNEDFTIDTGALTRVVEYCIAGGVDYLVVLGTTGESVVLSKKEKQLVIDTVLKANDGRLPLVLGVGGNNTAEVVEELKRADLKDFVAILSVSPYYNRPTQEGIYQHFKAISLVSPIPIILYNVPGRTGSNMLPDTVLRLANDFNNIVAIKEASGDMLQIMRLIKDKPSGFMVISGDDFTALPTVLAGGSGVISVLGQGLPSEFTQMIRFGLENKVKEAFNLQYSLLDGMDLIFKEGNPAGIKAVLEQIGIGTAVVRLPLVEATASLKKSIKSFVSSVLKSVV
ncbi:4-hydroxy-tetrahydrodipicolinate synthase [Arenibacter antarcticus]|uniref:4-hydroxy-tetrahydrodipicolinate synthase n=1 Tax=Arenibacter antarcticus TaxID=2040469 RepID=A0ABW5VGL0_9FLAO|nr:4-hydroxy-tetrahydrodipicolinate synthase [Arenibacter sp. H213]MCM4169752.1 4-hydroxy-tetrahydrodipicolinate synthase [Arenibacter sp. H213]